MELTKESIEEWSEVSSFLSALRDSTTAWLPVPAYTPGSELVFDFHTYELPTEMFLESEEARVRMTVGRFKAAARAIGGRWEKNDPKSSTYDDVYYVFTNSMKVGNARVRLRMNRDLICERVQVGTEKVTVPAQEAKPERLEERPVYERECKPLFARAEAELDEAMGELEGELESVEGS